MRQGLLAHGRAHRLDAVGADVDGRASPPEGRSCPGPPPRSGSRPSRRGARRATACPVRAATQRLAEEVEVEEEGVELPDELREDRWLGVRELGEVEAGAEDLRRGRRQDDSRTAGCLLRRVGGGVDLLAEGGRQRVRPSRARKRTRTPPPVLDPERCRSCRCSGLAPRPAARGIGRARAGRPRARGGRSRRGRSPAARGRVRRPGGRDLDAGPHARTFRRPDEDGLEQHRAERGAVQVGEGHDGRSWRPYAFVSIVAVEEAGPLGPGVRDRPREEVAPAQVPKTASPRRATSRIASSTPVPSISFRKVVDSPARDDDAEEARTSAAVRASCHGTRGRPAPSRAPRSRPAGRGPRPTSPPAGIWSCSAWVGCETSIPFIPSPRTSEAPATQVRVLIVRRRLDIRGPASPGRRA